MARKTKQQALETRQHILDVAIRLFSQQGVSSTSLAQIAQAALLRLLLPVAAVFLVLLENHVQKVIFLLHPHHH